MIFQRYLEQNGQLDFESIWKDEIGRDCIKENVSKVKSNRPLQAIDTTNFESRPFKI